MTKKQYKKRKRRKGQEQIVGRTDVTTRGSSKDSPERNGTLIMEMSQVPHCNFLDELKPL